VQWRNKKKRNKYINKYINCWQLQQVQEEGTKQTITWTRKINVAKSETIILDLQQFFFFAEKKAGRRRRRRRAFGT
jgi:hypothetical protein